jgi:hypothetical protein
MKSRWVLLPAAACFGPFVAISQSPLACKWLDVGCSPPAMVHFVAALFVAAAQAGAVLIAIGVAMLVLRKWTLLKWSLKGTITAASIALGVFGGLHALFSWTLSGPHYFARYGSELASSTHWAEGYTEQAFARVQIAWPEAMLISSMPPPLHTVTRGATRLYVYSSLGGYRTINEKGWHLRAVVVNGGVVQSVIQRYARGDETDPFSDLTVVSHSN